MTRRFGLIGIGLLALASACTGGPDALRSQREVMLAGVEDGASYEAAFAAARDELRDRGYLMERVDAPAGVIVTQRAAAVREGEDLANRQRHYVRVTFTPPAEGEAAMPEGAGGRVMLVRVIVERVQRPGWRVPTSSVRLASVTIDPELDDRGLRPVYAAAVKEDRDLAARLAQAIAARVGEAGAAR